jgi:hypothetical protein
LELTTVTTDNDTGTRVQGPARRGSPARWLAALALAWALPVVTHLLHADLILPVVVVLGWMSLQRGSVGLFDRLVVALVQLFALLCTAGLLFSYWPWKLHPVAVGGFALTGVVVFAFVSGRRPTLPRSLRPTERVILVGWLTVTVCVLVPFVARDLGGRLGILMPGEDFARHFVVYDMIGEFGGYAFLHAQGSLAFAPDHLATGVRNYPQGVHFGYAVLDKFLRSSPGTTDGVTAMNVLIWLYVATFLFFALTVLWALRRVAGPGANAARLLPVAALAAVWIFFGDPVGIFTRGFPNELVGLSLVAVLTAVVARPLTRFADQLATMALLLVGISFSYHMFLPWAGLMAALWAWRERLWRRPVAYLSVALILVPLLVTPYYNLRVTTGTQLTQPGTAQYTDRPSTALLVLIAGIGLLWYGGLRSPVRRRVAVALGVALGCMVLLGGYQLATIGRTIYYFEKTVHLTIVVSLVAFGGLVRLMPRRAPATGFLGLVRQALPGTALVLPVIVLLIAAGGKWHHTPMSDGLRLAIGIDKGSPAGGRDAILMTRMYPRGGGAMNVDLMSTPYRSWYGTLFGSAMQRNYRHGHDWYLFQYPDGQPQTLADLERLVAASEVPVRFFVYQPRASMLVIDPKNPRRESEDGVAGNAMAFGDPDALTNMEAAEHLKAKFPGKVEIVHATPPNP